MATDDAEQTKAAAFFTGVLTLCLGTAGLAVAGLVLGFDYLLHGEPHEREAVAERRAQQRRDRYADAVAWLDAERADRARARRAVRDWFEADPATRGDRPSSGETVGRVLARLWNSMIVGAHRFRRGWADGLREARDRRDAGQDRWWLPQRRRPSPPPPAPDAGTPPTQPPAPPHGNTPTDPPAPAQDDDIIDAEIIPDPPDNPNHSTAPVGGDQPAGADPAMGGYRQALDELATDVGHNQGSRNDHPSPPRSALR